MSKRNFTDFWFRSSKDDFKVAQDLFALKHFDHCLFFCHLALEKFLKGLISKMQEDVPPIHDLAKLAKLAQISADLEELREISTFNVSARYKVYKQELFKKATPRYIEKWLNLTENLLKLWSKKI